MFAFTRHLVMHHYKSNKSNFIAGEDVESLGSAHCFIYYKSLPLFTLHTSFFFQNFLFCFANSYQVSATTN